MGGVRQSAAKGLEGAVVSDCLAVVAVGALHSSGKHGTKRKKSRMKILAKRKCILYASAFVLALLLFGGRFPVSTSVRHLGAVNLTWSDGSPKTLQCPSSPWAYLWAPTDGRSCLAPCQTLWSCSHSHIQVHNAHAYCWQCEAAFI